MADGSYWVYQYDSLGQVISGKRYWADGTLMAGQDFDYQFDDLGNRTETGGRASAVSDDTLSGYPVNRLNQYQRRSVPAQLDMLGLANPNAGVQVWKDSDAPATATQKGEYFHRALTVSPGTYPQIKAKSLFGATQEAIVGRSYVPPATEIYTHDTDGNLTKDGRWDYVWDGENRLVEMLRDTASPDKARQKLTFEYDHLGRRIRKTYFDHNGTTWVEKRDTAYLYDGWNMVAEVDANNGNATLRTYVWGTNLSGNRTGAGGVGGLLWVNNAQSGLTAGIQFAAYDGNGNVAGLFAAGDGSNTARYEYGPFGESLRMTGTLAKANPVRWSTKVTDDEGGLVYYGYRYYSPFTGRWLNRDPIEEQGGENVYTFAYNSPHLYIDTDGRLALHYVLGGAAVIGAVIVAATVADRFGDVEPLEQGLISRGEIRKCSIVIYVGHEGEMPRPVPDSFGCAGCAYASVNCCWSGSVTNLIPLDGKPEGPKKDPDFPQVGKISVATAVTDAERDLVLARAAAKKMCNDGCGCKTVKIIVSCAGLNMGYRSALFHRRLCKTVEEHRCFGR